MPSPDRLYTHTVFVTVGTVENVVSIFMVSAENVSSLVADVVNESSSVQAITSTVSTDKKI
jgi:hypothetical protein